MKQLSYGKGLERRAWLMAKVPDGDTVAAVQRLQEHAMQQQWRQDWSIREIYTSHVGESRKLGQYAPKDEYHVFISVKAKNHQTLVKTALPKIHQALGGPPPQGHIMFSAMEGDH